MCILQSMQPIVYSLLILVSVFSDCVVFYGDWFLWELHGGMRMLGKSCRWEKSGCKLWLSSFSWILFFFAGHPQGVGGRGYFASWNEAERFNKHGFDCVFVYILSQKRTISLSRCFLLVSGIGFSSWTAQLNVGVDRVCVCRPELDIQLKSFHHEDVQMKTNWPASVSVRVNNYQLEICRAASAVDGLKGHPGSQRPVYLKHVCQPGQNMLQIAVQNCCCVRAVVSNCPGPCIYSAELQTHGRSSVRSSPI